MLQRQQSCSTVCIIKCQTLNRQRQESTEYRRQKIACIFTFIAKNIVDAKILRSLRDKVDLARTLVDDYRNVINPFQEKED